MRTQHFFYITFLLLINNYIQAQVGIGTPTPSSKLEVVGAGTTSATTALKVGNASSTIFTVRNDGLVEVASTTQGFLPPRMTATQRAAISSPEAGLLVYQTDAPAGLWYHNGSSWMYIINSTSATLPVSSGGTGTTTSTGTGSVVLSNSPTLITPTLGAATATSLNTSGTVTAGAITYPNTDGTNGQVLATNGAGVASWTTNVALTPAITATLTTTAGNIGENTYTGSSITLPPGKWSLQVTMLASTITNTGSYWIRSGFSTSSSTFTIQYIVGPTLVSGLVWGGKYTMITGTLICHNTTSSNLTLYYWTQGFERYDGGAITQLVNFGKALWGENSIVAYPMN